MQEHVAGDGGSQLDYALLRYERAETHALEVEADELLLLFGRQIRHVHEDGEPVCCRFGKRKGALTQLHGIHRRQREAELGQLITHLAHGHRAILQSFEKRALRLHRDAVDLVKQDHLGRGQRAELGLQGAGRGIDHLKAHDFRRLQVCAALNTRELRSADRGENHAKERFAHSRHATQKQVARVHLTALIAVVARGNFREQHDVRERLLRAIADERLASLSDYCLMKLDGFLQIVLRTRTAGQRRVHRVPDDVAVVEGGATPEKVLHFSNSFI